MDLNRKLRSPFRRPVRRAFTLVEILVSIAIIGILLTAVAIASVRMLAGAREQQTRTTIKKIDEILSSRMTAFERGMTGRSLAGGESTQSELLTKYEHLNLGMPSMRQKRLYGRFFGMSFGETFKLANGVTILAAPGVPFAADLTNAELIDAGYDSSKHQPVTENPEMLYWFITNGPTFGSDVQTDFNSSEVGDTDGDGLKEFIDAWGKPLRFYRWPTRLLRPGLPDDPAAQGSPYQSLGPAINDPPNGSPLTNDAPATFLIAALPTYKTAGDMVDPRQRPTTALGQDSNDAYGDVFLDYAREVLGPVDISRLPVTDILPIAQSFEVNYHTLNTWHAPLIVSAGADGELGLFEPTDRANFGHLAQPMPNAAGDAYSTALQDNVTNLNGQTSGTGGQ